MRVILDTNLLVSALITPSGPTHQLYRAWRERRFTLITSETQLEEFQRVTRYPKLRTHIESAAAGTMYNQLRNLAVVLTRLAELDVLKLQKFERTRIVTASRLLALLDSRPALRR